MGVGKVITVLGMILFSWVLLIATFYVLFKFAAPVAGSFALKGR
jgi:hypothetical protein